MVLENITTFIGKIRKQNSSYILTIPARVISYEGIKKNDYIKVNVVKLIKDKPEEAAKPAPVISVAELLEQKKEVDKSGTYDI